jgi:hypothetical protein
MTEIDSTNQSDNSNHPDDSEMVPLPGRVTIGTRRRMRVLAAQSDTTMGRLTEVVFQRGLDILENEQRQREAVEAILEEKAE